MWIEAITVRTNQPRECTALIERLVEFPGERFVPKPQSIACYHNMDVENEISVHLTWGETDQLPAKTACGQVIARLLARHGLVRHTLWRLSLSSISREGGT